ncbi:MAG TPA: hypothetical protein VMV46_21225 [Thermoanaerobaculia bacterium]|nr:hypothetical protein [Thermoanaerobaculia bacterium]
MLDRFLASSSPTARALAVGLHLLLALAPAGARESACHQPPAARPVAGDTIGLVAAPGTDGALIDQAIALWSGCSNYRSDFPALVRGADATATVFVEVATGNSGSKRCGFFRGRTITLYRWARTSRRTVRGCGSLALNLAHELGHVLGLADAAEHPWCSARIMADLERDNLFRRAVSAEECRLAGARWLTLAELDARREGGFERRPAARLGVATEVP